MATVVSASTDPRITFFRAGVTLVAKWIIVNRELPQIERNGGLCESLGSKQVMDQNSGGLGERRGHRRDPLLNLASQTGFVWGGLHSLNKGIERSKTNFCLNLASLQGFGGVGPNEGN